MPFENLEHQGLEKNPNLDIVQYKFLLSLREYAADEILHKKITEAIKKDNMAPWYEILCKDVGWKVSETFLNDLKSKNEDEIKHLDLAIEDAQTNLGEMEIKEAYLKKAEYYSIIGDKINAIQTFRETYGKTTSLGQKLDIVFHLIRLGLFFMDHDLISKSIEQAKGLVDEGGDWDRRNRLKVYEGMYCIAVRDFKTAATLFLDTVSTFTSYELMDYNKFICYAVYVSLISLPRNQLRDKVVKGPEILEVLHKEPFVKKLLFSLYECSYAEFFHNLAVAEELLKKDYLFNHHCRYYVREMKILAYSQLLESYRSLTLDYMAAKFGVSVDYIEKDLSNFIASGRLNCKIDKVGGIVETSRPNLKNGQFNCVVKHGDLLLSRVQKLSRVINI